MDLIQDIVARAKANKQRIVLPEGTEERTLKAADRLLAHRSSGRNGGENIKGSRSSFGRWRSRHYFDWKPC